MTQPFHGGRHPPHARYLRPDAGRYIRPDALRFIRPDAARVLAPGTTAADMFPGIDHKFRADQRRIPAGQFGVGRWTDMLVSLIFGGASSSETAEEDEGDEDNAEESGSSTGEEETFRNAYAEVGEAPSVEQIDASPALGSLRGESEGPELETDITPSEPGNADLADPTDPLPIVPIAQRSRSFTDKYGDPYYSPGGHHEMPQSTFRKWDLQPETRRVFDDATTGSLPTDTFRAGPDGLPQGHFWNGPDGAHGRYNQAVNELSEKFLSDRSIRPSDMTPDDAWQLLSEIRESKDPRIRDYNDSIRLLRRLRMLRTGRGSQ
jgi:hypothetical protein